MRCDAEMDLEWTFPFCALCVSLPRFAANVVSEPEIRTCTTGGIYPDRAAKQQTPVVQVLISQVLNKNQ